MATILLTDGQQRKTLAATRSLGLAGHQVWVADNTRFSTSRFSRYAKKGLLSPPPSRSDAYWQWLVQTQQRLGLEVFIPMDDDTTDLAVGAGRRLPFQTLLPLPEQFAWCRDKEGTARLADRAGIAAPRTVVAKSEAEALEAAAAMNWAAVLKARRSSGGRGLFFVTGPEQVRAAWRRTRPEWGGFLVQERIETGRKFDVCLLYGPTGDLRASFVQEELRWFPLEHGTSTLQVSVHRPDLVRLAHKLLAPIGWRGPVEVEFMEDSAGTPVLMEVNARFWASLALAIRCGIDFPALTADAALGGTATAPHTYPAGLRCRWLLPGDILHFLANPRRLSMQPGFFRTYDRYTTDDILSWDDPMPTVGFTLATLRYLIDPHMWRLLMRW